MFCRKTYVKFLTQANRKTRPQFESAKAFLCEDAERKALLRIGKGDFRTLRALHSDGRRKVRVLLKKIELGFGAFAPYVALRKEAFYQQIA